MISGIEAINNENNAAIYSALSSLESALAEVETSIRGRVNTTVISDRKSRVNPPSEENLNKIITSQEQHKVLSQSRFMSRIESGTFRINDSVIAIDPDKDTILDVIDKINSSQEGVLARFDPLKNRLDIYAKESDKVVSLNDDSTRFFSETNIKPGSYFVSTYAPMFHMNSGGRSTPELFANVEDSLEKLNTILNDDAISGDIKDALGDALIETLSKQQTLSPSSKRFYAKWGMDINFDKASTSTVQIDRNSFFSHVQKDTNNITSFFTGNQTDKGFISRAYKEIEEFQKNLLIDEVI